MSSENKDTRPARARIKRFFNSKAFYPAALGVIFCLCVSIWLVGKTNVPTTEDMTVSSSPVSQAAAMVTNVEDTRKQTTQQSTTKERVTAAYEANRAGEGEWNLPLKSCSIAKDFSNGAPVKSKTMGDYRIHAGIDFSAAEGESVFFINSGKVEDVSNDAFWGTVITVNHGGGVVAKYCGLAPDSVKVKKGELVKRGGNAGKVGVIPCENADGAHLHLETVLKNESTDPLYCMNMADGASQE